MAVSTLGTQMSFLAVPWLVLTTTGSAAKTGLVAFAEMAPYIAVQALGGPVTDRLGARAVSVGADLAAGALMAAIPLLWLARVLPLGALAALVAATGAARGGGDTARYVLVPGANALARGRIERASGLYDGMHRLAQLAGLPLAGALVALMPPALILGIDAATFWLSAGLVAILVPLAAQPPPEQQATGPASYLSSLAEGFSYLRRDRLLLAIAAMVAVTNFVDQAAGTVLIPVWAHDVAHSPVALGLIGGALSAGAVLGNAAATWAGPRLPRRITYATGFFAGGAPRFLALALCATLSPVLAVAFLGGLGLGGINPILGTVEYERVPQRLRARVLGAVNASSWAGIPLGGLAAGLVISSLGLRTALLSAAALYGLATLPPFIFPVWRQMAPAPRTAPSACEETPAQHRPGHLSR